MFLLRVYIPQSLNPLRPFQMSVLITRKNVWDRCLVQQHLHSSPLQMLLIIFHVIFELRNTKIECLLIFTPEKKYIKVVLTAKKWRLGVLPKGGFTNSVKPLFSPGWVHRYCYEHLFRRGTRSIRTKRHEA